MINKKSIIPEPEYKTVTVDITNINWDTDGYSVKKLGLPTELLSIDVLVEDPNDNEEIEHEICEGLSDTYGWCVNDFNWTKK